MYFVCLPCIVYLIAVSSSMLLYGFLYFESMYYHERHLQEKSVCGGGGGGDNWVIKIFGATNCNPPLHKQLEGHCGSDFCFLSSYVYCTCSEYLNMGRE